MTDQELRDKGWIPATETDFEPQGYYVESNTCARLIEIDDTGEGARMGTHFGDVLWVWGEDLEIEYITEDGESVAYIDPDTETETDHWNIPMEFVMRIT